MNDARLLRDKTAQAPTDRSLAVVNDETVLRFLQDGLDRALATPVGAQLRGLIEFGVTSGSLPAHTRLPAIRTLAQAAGLSAETVSVAYKTLQNVGLLVSYQGSGTFIAGAAAADVMALRQVEKAVDDAIAAATRSGIGIQDLVTMIRLRHAMPDLEQSRRALTIAMVGIFEEATQAYAADIASYLEPADAVTPLTIDQLRDSDLKAPADLYITLPSRERQVRDVVGGRAPVASISVIPSETTRGFLAALDPHTRLGLVARFEGFIGLMTEGAHAYAPHIRQMTALTLADPRLSQAVADFDVVVYSTGAEQVVGMLERSVRSAEFRHTPDPHAIRSILMPLIDKLKAKAG